MGRLFGTDGIRGEAGKYPLDASTIEKIGFSLASRLGAKARIVIGRDTRESGQWMESAIRRGIERAGAESLSAGVITTPGVAFLARELGAAAGVVISASHNPYHDNGIKIFSATGRKLSDEMELAIESDLAQPAPADLSEGASQNKTDGGSAAELTRRYFDYLRHEVAAGLDLTAIQGSNRIKLVLDCANGAASGIAPELFRELGAEVIVINDHPDGRNINLDCGALHPERLQQAVVDAGAMVGFAFDGDADRLMLVDERGSLLDGDFILHMMSEYLAARNRLSKRRVVATVMSNLGLELALRKLEIELVRTSVGDKYVLEELLGGGGSIGGEQSGHIIFPAISLAGDGIITAIEILRAVSESGRTVSDLASGMVRLPQILINVRVGRKPAFESVPEINEALKRHQNLLAGEGRILLRYSGTENIARIMIEGRDEATIELQAKELADLIAQHLS